MTVYFSVFPVLECAAIVLNQGFIERLTEKKSNYQNYQNSAEEN